MLHIDLKPSATKLRQFGLLAPVMLVVIGLMLMWRAGAPVIWPIAMGGAGLVLLVLSRISPRLILPFYLGLVILGFPIGWVVSHLVMFLFFFGIITPIAFVFRLAGRDLLCRKLDRTAESYWTDSSQDDTVERYFRQF